MHVKVPEKHCGDEQKPQWRGCCVGLRDVKEARTRETGERNNTRTRTAVQEGSPTRGPTLRTNGTIAARLNKYMGGAAGQNDEMAKS